MKKMPLDWYDKVIEIETNQDGDTAWMALPKDLPVDWEFFNLFASEFFRQRVALLRRENGVLPFGDRAKTLLYLCRKHYPI